MADIKQAADWLNDGKHVRRPCMELGAYFFKTGSGFIEYRAAKKSEEFHDMFEPADFIADDWEIA